MHAFVLTQRKQMMMAGGGAAPAARLHRLRAVQAGQEQVLTAADGFANSRADRLRMALKLAGVASITPAHAEGALGGPLIEANDPRALAAVLDVDPAFAQRVQ